MESAPQLHAMIPLIENDSRPEKETRKELGSRVLLCIIGNSPSSTKSRSTVVFGFFFGGACFVFVF